MTNKELGEKSLLQGLLDSPEGRIEYARSTLETSAHALLWDAFTDSKLSKAEFGRRLGVSRARAGQILNGETTNVTLGLIGRSAGALGLRWKISLLDLATAEELYSHAVSPITETRTCRFETVGRMFGYLAQWPGLEIGPRLIPPIRLHPLNWEGETSVRESEFALAS